MDANDLCKKPLYEVAMDALSGVPMVYGELCAAFKPLMADAKFKGDVLVLVRSLQSAANAMTTSIYDTAIKVLERPTPGVDRFCHALIRLDWADDSELKMGIVDLLDRHMTPVSQTSGRFILGTPPPPLVARATTPVVVEPDVSEFELRALTDQEIADYDQARAKSPVHAG